MTHEQLLTACWEEMLTSEMRSNYFAELVLKYQNREKWLRVATLVASSGAAASALSGLPAWIGNYIREYKNKP